MAEAKKRGGGERRLIAANGDQLPASGMIPV